MRCLVSGNGLKALHDDFSIEATRVYLGFLLWGIRDGYGGNWVKVYVIANYTYNI